MRSRGGSDLPAWRRCPWLRSPAVCRTSVKRPSVLSRSHGGHTEVKETPLDRVAYAAHLSAVGKPTGLHACSLGRAAGHWA